MPGTLNWPSPKPFLYKNEVASEDDLADSHFLSSVICFNMILFLDSSSPFVPMVISVTIILVPDFGISLKNGLHLDFLISATMSCIFRTGWSNCVGYAPAIPLACTSLPLIAVNLYLCQVFRP